MKPQFDHVEKYVSILDWLANKQKINCPMNELENLISDE